jgi:hypothetical protein
MIKMSTLAACWMVLMMTVTLVNHQSSKLLLLLHLRDITICILLAVDSPAFANIDSDNDAVTTAISNNEESRGATTTLLDAAVVAPAETDDTLVSVVLYLPLVL